MLIDRYFPNLTPRQREQFAAMPDLYKEWNAKINVISRKDIDQVEEHHILHSLAIAKTDLIAAGESVLDVGCGGGFPGIPLAVYYPDVQFTLVDSIGKKIKVVREVASALGLTNVRAEHCRVEQLGRLLEIFFRGKDQNIKFLLPQRRCQAHNAFQPICTHHAWFLVGEITAGEEG